jgi:predicted ATPase
MLTRASFQNFKALKAVDVDLTPFTVIVGKNGSGKTSVLQGIFDVARVASGEAGDTSFIFSGVQDLRKLVTMPGRGPLRVALTDTDARSFSVEAQIVADNRGEIVRFMLGVAGDDTPSETPLESQQAARLLASPAVRRLGSAVFLRLDAEVMARVSVPSSEEPRLEHNGEGLASVLSYMAMAEPERLEAVRRDLTAVVPGVRGIRTGLARFNGSSPNSPPAGHRFSLDMGPGRLVPADLLSEGTVLALGLLTALHHPQSPRLVLMDDIDAALHTSAQVELLRCLRSILASRPDVQIVCTSHSPDLLDQVSLEEVRVMALDKDGYARCRRLSDHPESAQWRKMLRTGEFWASVGEDWVVEASGDGR